MRWRQVIFLYVVLALLAGEYFVRERPGDAPAATEPRTKPHFLDLQPADVRELRLIRSGRTVVSRLNDGRWTLVEPADAPIPADLIAAFATALTGAEEIERVSGGTEAAGFGLDDQAVRVEIVAGNGHPVGVTLGAPNPTGTAIYARRDDRPDVVLIGRNVRYYEDLIFQALPAPRVPANDEGVPIG